MVRLPQFTLQYLLAMMFWWSLAFVMLAEVWREGENQQSHGRLSYYVLLLPVAACAALGGLFLKMRAGFVIGLLASAVIWVIVVFAERFLAINTF